MKFIENYRFLLILGSSIEPEKPSAKSASTANPPQKVKIMGFLLKFIVNIGFIISRLNLKQFMFELYVRNCVSGVSVFDFLLWNGELVFLLLGFFVVCSVALLLDECLQQKPSEGQTKPLKQGTFRRRQ
jgi:hypothetical protein